MGKLLLSLADYEKFSGIPFEDMPQEISRENDNKRCAYCGVDKPFAKDHVIPRSRGGADDPGNLVWCCTSCNSKKHARTPDESGMPIVYIEESRVD